MVGELVFGQLPYGTMSIENSCFTENVYNVGTARASFRTEVFIDELTHQDASKVQNDQGNPILCLGLSHDTTNEPECIPFEANGCSLELEPDPFRTKDCPARRLTQAPTAAPTDPSSNANSVATRMMALLTIAAMVSH